MAKNKDATVKNMIIPKLELMASVIVDGLIVFNHFMQNIDIEQSFVD